MQQQGDFPQPPDPSNGSARPSGAERDGVPDHAEGFNRALQAALDAALWSTDEYFVAEVQLRAVVSRENPGKIDEYRATVVPTGRP
jgi:hypothetical protein